MNVSEEKMGVLDPNKNKICKFLIYKQAGKIDEKRALERVKKEIRQNLNYITGLNLNSQNLMKAINYQVIPVVVYVMNVWNLENSDLNELDIQRKVYCRENEYMEKIKR